MTAAKALQIVEERLSCSVCLENFTQPKFLPCHHAFCQDCLSHLSHQRSPKGRYTLECPVCRRPAQLPKDGISGLPNAFHISDLIEVRETLRKLTDVHPVMSEATATASKIRSVKRPLLECSKHEMNLSVYCHTCDQLICRDCTVRDHRDHVYDPISDKSVFIKYRQEIKSSLQSTKQKLAFVLQTMEVFNKRVAEITENRDKVKEEIQAIGDQMIAEYVATVRQSMGQLAKKADMGADQKLKFISAQMEDIQTTAAMLQSCVEYVEGELRMSSQQQILAGKRQIVDRMNVVTSQVKEEKYSLTEEPNIKILKNTGKNTNVGEIEFSMLVDRCKVSGVGIMKTHIRRKTKFSLAIKPTLGSAPLSLPTSLISCQLFAPEANCLTDCNVTETAPGRYEVGYTPVTSGPHQLRVRVGDVDIPGSPFMVQVKMRSIPLRTIRGLNRPFGVAVGRDSCVMVTEYHGHCVTLLDKEEKKSKSFGSYRTNIGQFSYPRGVDVTLDGKIVVADRFNHRVHKFDKEGRFVAAVGSQGNGQLQFQYPTGITIDKSNKILVADCGNDRIQVMNSDFTFSHTFGGHGSQSGRFHNPICIAIDSKGMVYVTDRGNHRVQKFTSQGVFVAQFGKRGEGELTHPRGIAIDTTTDTVYVSSNHKVSAFTTNGKFLEEFGIEGSGEENLSSPCGLVVDENMGDLYVCDFDNDRLVVY